MADTSARAIAEIVDSAHWHQVNEGWTKGRKKNQTSDPRRTKKKKNTHISSSGNGDYYCNTGNKNDFFTNKQILSMKLSHFGSFRTPLTDTLPALCMPEDRTSSTVIKTETRCAVEQCSLVVISFFFGFFPSFFLLTCLVTCKRWSIYIYIIYMCNINIYIYILMCVCVYTISSS